MANANPVIPNIFAPNNHPQPVVPNIFAPHNNNHHPAVPNIFAPHNAAPMIGPQQLPSILRVHFYILGSKLWLTTVPQFNFTNQNLMKSRLVVKACQLCINEIKNNDRFLYRVHFDNQGRVLNFRTKAAIGYVALRMHTRDHYKERLEMLLNERIMYHSEWLD